MGVNDIYAYAGVVSGYLDFVAVDDELVAGCDNAVDRIGFDIDKFVYITVDIGHAEDFDGDGSRQRYKGFAGAEAEGYRVLLVVVDVLVGIEGAADIGMEGEVACADGVAVAELVCHFIEELVDVVHEFVILALKAAAVFQGGAYFLDGKCRLAVCPRDVQAFRVGQIVRVQFDLDFVQDVF